MQTRFLLGPAGSGKTFRCLAEIRAALKSSPDGAPLILVAPKQATFQLERQLLADEALAGYTRLRIFSFERLAEFILEKLQTPPAQSLSEEGRVMVLRALLSQKKEQLKIFRSSARMPGFAQQLSLLLRDLQRHQLTSGALVKLATRIDSKTHLAAKLHDLALLLDAYFEWLKRHELQDANRLLDCATDALNVAGKNPALKDALRIEGLWLDGFAEMTPQETGLLAALVPSCQKSTLAFCLESTLENDAKISALSIWSVVKQTFQNCFDRLKALPGCQIEIERLPREITQSRFEKSTALRHLENFWTHPQPFSGDDATQNNLSTALRLVTCSNAEAEATLAAHEILRFVRKGGRFRETAVLLRQFDGYHDALRRVFSRYDIPFFLDRRESIAHHPLAELTRSALRLAAFGWEHDDWFGALKTGLVTENQNAVDELENEALARGWKNAAWLHPLTFAGDDHPPLHLEKLRERLVPPFQKLVGAMQSRNFWLNGTELSDALNILWQDLKTGDKLETWAESNPVHLTIWDQMHEWLKNIANAFPVEKIRLAEWLPILDSGLAGLTVGAIPPALDQVLIGTIDRSRNPDLRLALVLGLNESVFPAPPRSGNLLTESDQAELSKHVSLGPNKLELLGRERFYGYIACTRARERLVMTSSAQDENGRALNPSPFFSLLQQLFPALSPEKFSMKQNWFEAEHWRELMAPLFQARMENASDEQWAALTSLPVFDGAREKLARISVQPDEEKISAEIVKQIYGETLKSSVSALEQFAACPFRFFINVGLRAEERKLFELDVKERGSFQHEVLAEFHDRLTAEKKRWRDVSISEAREMVARIAEELKNTFQNGLLLSTAQTDFSTRSMTESLQNFIETIIGWMGQYEFDPCRVELGFGTKEKLLPAWEIDLGENRILAFRGVIDRVDICPLPGGEALAVVIDYKSSAKQIDPVLFANGLQLQLPAYLAMLRQLSDPQEIFGVKRLIPAGIFYINLRGRFGGGKTRDEILSQADESRLKAYQHAGRFDFSRLPQLDNGGATSGTQFNYRLKKDGEPYATSRDVLPTEDFERFLTDVEQQLALIGKDIFSGNVKIDPYQKGKDRACDQCACSSVCRIDSWTHRYRPLKALPTH